IGVPFYLHGEEVLRSKMFHDNSFNLPLCVNALSYNFTNEQRAMQDYYRGLIAFRKKAAELHLYSKEDVEQHFQLIDTSDKPLTIAFTIDNLLVVYNASNREVSIPSPVSGRYYVYVENDKACDLAFHEFDATAGDAIAVGPIRAMVCRREDL
nr:hypothetical protein [Lachnospiraceae bacterium]